MKRNETTVNFPSGPCGRNCRSCRGFAEGLCETIPERNGASHLQLYATEAEQYYYYRELLIRHDPVIN